MIIKHDSPSAGFASMVFDRFDVPPPPSVQERAEESTQELELAVALPTVQEVESMYRDAFEKGFTSGRAEGLVRAQEDLNALMSVMQGLKDRFAQVEQEASKVIMGMVDEVLREVCRSSQTCAQLLEEDLTDALREIESQAPVRIRLSGDDVRLLQEVGAYFDGRSVELVSDDTLSRGGFVLDGESTRIDARVERRVKSIVEALRANS